MSCVLSSKPPFVHVLSVLSTVTMTLVGKSIWTHAGLLNNARLAVSQRLCVILQYQSWAFEIQGK